MALPKRLYDCYKLVTKCKLLAGDTSDDAITEFQTLLNNAQPVDDVEELAKRSLTKGMYYSNQEGFIRYISTTSNRVSALILWTESKRIVKFFDLQGKVHLSWNDETNTYVAQKHLKPSERPANRAVNGTTNEVDSVVSSEVNSGSSRGSRGGSRGVSNRGVSRGVSRGGSRGVSRGSSRKFRPVYPMRTGPRQSWADMADMAEMAEQQQLEQSN